MIHLSLRSGSIRVILDMGSGNLEEACSSLRINKHIPKPKGSRYPLYPKPYMYVVDAWGPN